VVEHVTSARTGAAVTSYSAELRCLSPARSAAAGCCDQLIQVIRKGARARQWLPVSPDAVVWLRLYYAAAGTAGPGDPVWPTRRRRTGLRYTCAIRMLRDIQNILGHAHLTTTEAYLGDR
jgi:integrase